ncbi:MAG: transposase [Peptococcaceae bacterium]|nr:transposase [Peptococcaceae bacterium]
MAEVFLQLKEAADLEQINYNSVVQRLQRNPEAFETKTVPAGSAGGKDRILVALTSLSPKAQRRYQAEQSRTVKTDEVTDVIAEKRIKDGQAPWYIEVELEEYKAANPAVWAEAEKMADAVRNLLNYTGQERTTRVEAKAQELGISQRSLYRRCEDYLEAAAWAGKLRKLTGNSYDYLKILSQGRKPRSNRQHSISPEVKAIVENIWFNPTFARNQGTVVMLYDALRGQAKEKGFDVPSYATVARFVRQLMADGQTASAHYLVSHGERAWKRDKMIKARRDTGALRVMELIQGDEHTFDCWVLYRHPNGQTTPIRPKLVAWVDIRSRMILGSVLCKDANSQILKLSLLKLIYSTPGGVPRWLMIDNGRDYTAKDMTGGRQKRHMDFDDEGRAFYRSIGIEDYSRSKPYEPWTKGQIERFFGTVCNQFTKWMGSYVGTLTGSRTDGKIPKDIQRLADQGKLLTMEEFGERWEKWLTEVYAVKKHSGLTEQKEEDPTPAAVFEHAPRYFKAPPPRDYAAVLMMKAEEVRVYNVGIRRFGTYYHAQELAGYIGQKVNIRYDPENITSIFVYDRSWKRITEAYSQELLAISPRISSRAVEEHIRAQAEQRRMAKEIARQKQQTLEERQGLIASSTGAVGASLDKIIEGSGHPDKIVSLPRESYAEEAAAVESRENRPSYLTQKGKRTLEILKRLG